MLRTLVVIGLGATGLLLAADQPKEKVQVSKTEHMDFPSGGTLRLTNSIGVLTVEAWDRPDVEITTIKSTKDEHDASERENATHQLDKVQIAAERRGEELVIATTFHRYDIFPVSYPLVGDANLDVEYRIKAPSSARLIVDHKVGEVNVDGLVGDMNVTVRQGQILLHLPETGPYNIHAKSDCGNVNSDFPGEKKSRRGRIEKLFLHWSWVPLNRSFPSSRAIVGGRAAGFYHARAAPTHAGWRRLLLRRLNVAPHERPLHIAQASEFDMAHGLAISLQHAIRIRERRSTREA
jgi:hypothetical protein